MFLVLRLSFRPLLVASSTSGLAELFADMGILYDALAPLLYDYIGAIQIARYDMEYELTKHTLCGLHYLVV